jgi:hypothetical protein
MKNILIIFAVIFTTVVFAQSTSPRYSTTINKDNTYRALSLTKVAVTDTTGADSTVLTPKNYSTLIVLSVLDSFCFKQPVVNKSYLGDELTILCTGTSGDKVKFNGSNWITSGTATLSSGLRAVIKFIFDGAKFVETSRVVQ